MSIFVKQYTIAPGIIYRVHPHHRNRTPGKSQWTISENQERDVFVNSRRQNWLLGDLGWGLHIVAKRVAYLGVASNPNRQLFVAKFVSSNRGQAWHGYPADHQRYTQDIPAEPVLHSWLTSGLLPPQKIAKIQKGKPCNL